MSKIKGLIAAAHTPMDAEGALNHHLIKPYASFLKANMVNGVFLCGTTGESASLTMDERMKVADTWTGLALDDFHVIVHVGHNSFKESKKLAKHASESGADAISAIAPGFFKPATIKDLISYCSEIASEAPELPFYFYHIPMMSGVRFQMIEFIENLGESIPSFAGIKFTHEDIMDYGLCLGYKEKKYDMLFGRDEMLLSALCLGAEGAVGSTYNFMAPLYCNIIEAYQRGDLKQAAFLQHKAMQFIRVLIHYGGGIVAGKAIMKLVGMDCGPVRLPLKSVDDTMDIYHDLKRLGFFEYCVKTEATGP